MKTFMMSSAAALLVAGSAFAGASWDANADKMIDQDEFQAGMQSDVTFDNLDSDGDGMVSEDEFSAAAGADASAFGEWDADTDAQLTREEFGSGVFSEFDADSDDMWSEDETAAWEENELRSSAMRSGASVSPGESTGTTGEAGAGGSGSTTGSGAAGTGGASGTGGATGSSSTD